MTARPGRVTTNLSPLQKKQQAAAELIRVRVSAFSIPLWSHISIIGRGIESSFVRLWRRFLAETRLSSTAVCEESLELGCYDYHTNADDVDGASYYTEGGAKCKRCGKRFRL